MQKRKNTLWLRCRQCGSVEPHFRRAFTRHPFVTETGEVSAWVEREINGGFCSDVPPGEKRRGNRVARTREEFLRQMSGS